MSITESVGTADDCKSFKFSARRSFLWDKLAPVLIISPVIVTTLTFVYVFIVLTVLISLSDWSAVNLAGRFTTPLSKNYSELFGNPRFQMDLRNTVVFTVMFLVGSVGLGLVLALLVDRQIRGKGRRFWVKIATNCATQARREFNVLRQSHLATIWQQHWPCDRNAAATPCRT